MEEAIVLYPSPPIGHLISMVELGKLLLTQKPSLSIHILITSVPYDSGSTAPYIAYVAATIPSIKFHHLPTVTLPSTKTTHHEELAFEVLRLSNPHVREELLSISKNYTIHGLVVDFFCCAALSVVADELHIPSYFFITSGACFLALYLHLPTLHQNTTKSFKDMKEHFLNVPELLPVLATDMPQPFLERDNKAYQYSLDFATQVPQAAGIMINTFEFLESKFVRPISDGLCVPDNPTPPIYCIGPLIVADDKRGGSSKTSRDDDVPECLTSGAAEGNSYWFGKKWPKIYVDGSGSTLF
ncbi:UDP-glycosyltransferase 88A1-like [Populus alba x Populus x berolinensis]|nr:UDP-glycosyltransferase 88A1-like [Populus alba x Populus x berolinensis]